MCDERSDLFSVGVMLYQALTGNAPWGTDGSFAGFTAGVVPDHVASICENLLARDPDRRPRRAVDVGSAIKASSGAIERSAFGGWRRSVPWTKHELAARVRGPERLLHLPSDAAALLFARTRGDPSKVVTELSLWLRARTATLDGDELIVARTAIDALMAWPEGSSRRGQGPGRWLAKARGLIVGGRLAAAEPLLREVIRHSAAPPIDSRRLHEAARLWAQVAISSRDRSLTARFLYELSKLPDGDTETTQIKDLVRAFDGSAHWTTNAFDAVCAIPRFKNTSMEQARWAVRAFAARKVSVDALRREVRSAKRAHGRSTDPGWRAELARMEGRLLYVEERYASAARLHRRAARFSTRPAARLDATMHAASALMEAFDFEGAMRLANEARKEAQVRRLAYLEGRAEWIWRSAADRSRLTLEPDFELVAAAQHLDAPDLVLLLSVTEATIAFRHKDGPAFQHFTRIAREACGVAGETLGMATLDGMEIALGIRSATQDDKERPEELVRRGVPRLALEFAALSGANFDSHKIRWLRGLSMAVPARFHAERMGVLSVGECLALLGITKLASHRG